MPLLPREQYLEHNNFVVYLIGINDFGKYN